MSETIEILIGLLVASLGANGWFFLRAIALRKRIKELKQANEALVAEKERIATDHANLYNQNSRLKENLQHKVLDDPRRIEL
jgi:hypothetical protein